MRKISLCFICTWLSLNCLKSVEVPDDYRYHVEILAQSILRPMELEIAQDGRIFVNDFEGALHIIRPDSGESVTAGKLEVFNEQENGFLGFALDPDFPDNHWIYLFYSPPDYSGQRLSRFEMDGDTLVMSSEKVMLEFLVQREQCCHHAGTLEFDPDGNLLISTGDNTFPGAPTGGSAPIDERPEKGPWDAQKSSANTHDLRGKILRIRPTPEGGYEIPDGNLFAKDGSEGRPEIFVMGCRNPWRMSIDERTGIVYWGEVGPDAGSDTERGPRGYDEINQARMAGNFGWPYFVGNNYAYADHDFATGKNGPRYDPIQPINESPNNYGSRVLPPAQPAFIYWPYADSPEFPILGSGGRTACAGPVFHFKPEFELTHGFPAYFDNCLLFWDWQRPFMKWARLDSESNLDGIEEFTQAVLLRNEGKAPSTDDWKKRFLIQRPVDAQFGPDGCLYLLDYGRTWGANEDSQLIKISYHRGNLPPVAVASASPDAGKEPLTVKLSAEGSMDYEGNDLRYTWTVHPGDLKLADGKEASVTVEYPGNYIVTLNVEDEKGAVTKASIPLLVGNSRPVIQIVSPKDGDFFEPGSPIDYEVHVVDAEDGDSTHNDEFMDAKVSVTATFKQSLDQQETIPPGQASMRNSDCFNCHAVTQRIVGPPLLEIANRYRDQTEALAETVQRIIKGSTGVWGEVPMLPHSQLAEQEVEQMVRWIYGLKSEDQGQGRARGLVGSLESNGKPNERIAIIEASYTDFGQAPASPLSANTRVQLRHRKIEAEHGDAHTGLKILGNKLGAIEHGATVRFKNVPLSQVSGVTVRVASGGPGCRMDLRQGSEQGPIFASFEIEPTGGYDKFIELTTPIITIKQRADVVITFSNPGKGGLMDLDWLRFNR
ncbi:MAG: carbohydrate-binding protein [Verrucomicrobia bacterium]|jgi:cytochrome c|nr:carbohydrate-binding protein [Verrucomicrobiota bacterium]